MSGSGTVLVQRAVDALRNAEQTVQELRAALDARDALLGMSALPELIIDLVLVTKRPPSWHLGHLSLETFELVRKRLGTTAKLSVHDDGERFLLINEERCGLIIQAQTTAPPAESSVVEEQTA